MGANAESLREPVAELHAKAESAGRPVPEVVLFGRLPDAVDEGAETLRTLEAVGVTRFVHSAAGRYTSVAPYREAVDHLCRVRDALGS